MIFATLGAQDAEKYWELRLEALKKHPEAFATSYEEAINREDAIEKTRRNLSSDHSVTFGAFNDEGELAGVVTLMFEQKEKLKHKAHLVAMYVKPEYRKKGVAKGLIHKAVNTARRLKYIVQIQLAVTSENEPAKRLYESMGFEAYGIEKRSLQVGNQFYDDILMVLNLK